MTMGAPPLPSTSFQKLFVKTQVLVQKPFLLKSDQKSKLNSSPY